MHKSFSNKTKSEFDACIHGFHQDLGDSQDHFFYNIDCPHFVDIFYILKKSSSDLVVFYPLYEVFFKAISLNPPDCWRFEDRANDFHNVL